LNIISPAGGEVLIPGIKYEILWDAYRLSILKIEYSIDGGLSWIEAATGTFQNNKYLWTVPNESSSRCKIRITGLDPGYKSVISDGLFTISGPSGVSDAAENTVRPFITASVHPNPFNPSTVIRYELGQPGRVLLRVFNALGQKVRRFDLGPKGRGVNEFRLDGSGLTSGVYFFRIETGDRNATGKMLLVR
jgi:hypothetical protein